MLHAEHPEEFFPILLYVAAKVVYLFYIASDLIKALSMFNNKSLAI